MLFHNDIFTLKKYRSKDLEKALIFKEIYSRRSASQKLLREKHKIRPTSVSLIFK